MALAFWIAALLLAQTYALYPLSLPLLRLILPRRSGHKGGIADRPRVSMLIAAYNEEKAIEEKIRNTFELEFNGELEILIGSDGSTDRTESIASKYTPGVKLSAFPQRSGKAKVLNQLVSRAQGDILVFCDANTLLLKNALQKLLSHFDDSKVGCVCGRLILHDAGHTALGVGESMYWNLESEIKKMEGSLGIVIGANGGLYAMRKELFEPIPTESKVMDDFFTTTRVLKAGKSAIYEPQAIGSEETSLDTFGEFHRKVRISQANFNHLSRYLSLLNPIRPLVAYGFISHKLLRWIAPLLLVFLFGSNLFLAPTSTLYAGLLGTQALFYLIALLGYSLNGRARKYKLLLVPYYFVSMNAALLIGMFKSMFTQDTGTWNRVERAESQLQTAGVAPIPPSRIQAGDYPN